MVFFVYFLSIVCDQGMKEGWRARMPEPYDITRYSLGSLIVENIECGRNDLRLGFYAAEWNG